MGKDKISYIKYFNPTNIVVFKDCWSNRHFAIKGEVPEKVKNYSSYYGMESLSDVEYFPKFKKLCKFGLQNAKLIEILKDKVILTGGVKLNIRYYDFIKLIFPDSTIKVSKSKTEATRFYDKGKLIAVIMPIHNINKKKKEDK